LSISRKKLAESQSRGRFSAHFNSFAIEIGKIIPGKNWTLL
jgi:hypothetical protein